MENITENTDSVFPGFEHEDLSIYLRHAWTDEDHNEARKSVQERLDLLIGDAFGSFASQYEAHGLELKRSHFQPCKENGNRVEAAWIYLVRNQRFRSAARKEAEKKRLLRMVAGHPEHFQVHPTVAARLNADGLFVGVALPRNAVPDSELFLERMKGKKQIEQLLSLLSKLPEGFVLSDGQETMLPVDQLTAPAIKMGMDSFARGVGWLMVGQAYSRDEALNRPTEIERSLDQVIPKLEKIYAFLSFRPPREAVAPRHPNRSPNRGRPPRGDRRPGPKPLKRPPELSDRVKMRAGTFKGKVGTVLDLQESEMQVKFGFLPVWVKVSDALVLPPRKH